MLQEDDPDIQLAGHSTVWTIGHSTRPIEEFIELLRTSTINTVVDVRRFPGSRRYPQFNQSALSDSLTREGIAYVWLPELGGRRTPRSDSPNTAWRNASFRAYADYMETDAFRTGVHRVTEAAARANVALMCSEAVWWRCHRSLIADYLKAREYRVVHILSANNLEEHPFTSAARIVAGELSYAA